MVVPDDELLSITVLGGDYVVTKSSVNIFPHSDIIVEYFSVRLCVCVCFCVTYVLSTLILVNTILIVDCLHLPDLPSYTPTLISPLLYADTNPSPYRSP